MPRNKSCDNQNSNSNNSLFNYFRKTQSNQSNPTKLKSRTHVTVPKNNGPAPKLASVCENIFYPNFPEIRQYQFNISMTCLFYNTMVCLPTGMGKTHISSIIILNFYKWFAQGKIYFLAPTRPLVFQQKKSLHSFKDFINQDDIIQINGQFAITKRAKAYQQKRIFFMTPQTFQNDLNNDRCQIDKTVLIIFDEAHRATGNYAYVNIVKKLEQEFFGYRIIGLSATPGNNLQQVQEVITNLKIARMQVKDETDVDVKRYTHNKIIEPIEIRENQTILSIQKMLNDFIEKPLKILIAKGIVEPFVIKMIRHKGLNSGSYFQIYQNFKKNEEQFDKILKPSDKSLIYNCFRILQCLTAAKKTLRQEGYESFKGFLQKMNDENFKLPFKEEIIKSQSFKKIQQIMQKQHYHPKMIKLRQILIQFFNNKQNIISCSKVIIFTQHRTTALQIKNYIEKIQTIKPTLFVGQSKTMNFDSASQEDSCSIIQLKQKQQIQVIEKFKNNELNTLISTSIGEEGLDIGEIDLIICYDNGMSPIRMIQRMGRTGRKRSGKVILLLMQGKQYASYEKANKKSKSLKTQLRNNSKVSLSTKISKQKINFFSFNCPMLKQNQKLSIVYVDNNIIKDSPIKVKKKQKIIQEQTTQQLSQLKKCENKKKKSHKQELKKQINLEQEECDDNSSISSQNSDLLLFKLQCETFMQDSQSTHQKFK